MITPNQMIDELGHIKSAVDQIEIKGSANANFVLYACQKCEFLIESVNEVLRERAQKEEPIEVIQNEGVEAGE